MCVQYIDGGGGGGGGVLHASGRYHEYIGYHEYVGGCSVHRRDIMSASGDIMCTSGNVRYIGGIL